MINAASLKGPMSWSLISLLVIGTYGIIAMTNSFAPLFTQSNELRDESQATALIERHDELIAMDVARFEGRSAFFKPVRKPPPPAPTTPVSPVTPKERPPDPGPPPPPSTYMGPELIAIIGDEAWFRGSSSSAVIRLVAGNELDGLKVLSTSLPSMVTVEYRRGVYELDLFVVEEPFFLEQAPPAPDTSFLKEVDDTNGEVSPS